MTNDSLSQLTLIAPTYLLILLLTRGHWAWGTSAVFCPIIGSPASSSIISNG
ncbi:hypothetical protein LC605_02265 [Nostoc sp. CHAB 5836]|uniref:hypothetical protein n=1 Tax=Nostoc sp. CHAB 5836 TaxID=2780404 RepID=UPI001E5E8DC0|nr:hypothetical protein [Nostoc sp. CHAB 5836]MCC5613921.1 hypothetical protein [Nostoc sp. CHAB 5836]